MKDNRVRAMNALETLLAGELNAVRVVLILYVDDPAISLIDFLENCIVFWNEWLNVDRIFVTDMRTGEIVAGWKKGMNIVNLQDWDTDYVPLESDETLQEALVTDQLIASPTPGIGADLAFSLPLANEQVYLVALDQTKVARVFSELDMAYIALAKDLAIIKSRLVS